MVRRTTRTVGLDAENRAFRYLRKQGLQPVVRNFRSRLGEIDLIMRDGDCLVFVEVRYRATARFTAPQLTVDRYKQRKLVRTAAFFAAKQSRYANCVMRFDVVAIEGDSIEWMRDAFRPADASL